MPYFVKKPIPIEAVQQDKPFTVKIIEGTMFGKAGDYLVTGVDGEQYPVDREIFESTYEEVSYRDWYNYHENNDFEKEPVCLEKE